MADKVELTDRKLANLAPAKPGARYEIADTHIGGLRVRVGEEEGERGKAASVSFVLLARFPPSTNPTRRTLGAYPAMSLADARELAKEWKGQIAKGIDPKAEDMRQRADAEREREAAARNLQTFNKVADSFLRLHVDKAKLRSASEVRRLIDIARLTLGETDIATIRRRDVVALLDTAEEERGATSADRLLAILSKLFAWWAARDDEFASPIVRGMRRTSTKDRARDRIFTDAELRAFWAATGTTGTFGAMCRLLLLTGQRRAKVAAMRWQDIDAAGLWTIPAEAREKTNAGAIALPQMARDELAKITPVKSNPYVFVGRNAGTHVAGFSKLKPGLDAGMLEALRKSDDGATLAPWVLHDLRRTARSLMSRAGVKPDIAERTLGHAIVGVQGTYDRHSYADEKADALAKMAGLLALILDPPKGNVVRMERVGA